MHTGYDNYWMYQNRRQDLVLCLPKNDNFSRPVFTDNYKQVQGTGHPSNLGNYISPPNTFVRHHQKVPQDQHLVTGSQSMWPTSVCLPPYTSSLTHNFISHDIFPVQPSSICDSSQPMNQGLRNMQNSHVNISQVQSTTNYKASAGPVNSQNNNFKAQTARIRVKDIFSLNNDNSNNINNNNNNNNNNNIPSLPNGDLCQTQQKKQHYYPFNSAMFRNSRMYNGQTQRECSNYDNISELNHSYQNYGHPATHLNSEQQYLQPPSTFYQQNAQCTYEGPLCYNNVQQISEKSSEAFNRRNYPLLRQTLNENVIQQADVHNTQLESDRHSDNNIGPSKNFGYNLPSVTESNETSTTNIQNQSALSKTIQAPCLTFISSGNDQRMDTTATSPHHNPLNSQEISAIRLTNPHIGPSPNNSSYSEPNRNSETCLPALGASDSNPVSATRRNSPAHDEVSTQEDAVVNLPETTEGSSVSPKSSHRRSTVTHSSGEQEHALDRNVSLSGNHRTGSPAEGVRGGTCKPASSKDEVAVCQNEVVLLTPKVEKFDAEGENFEDEEAVRADEAVMQMIKTEVDLPPQDGDTEEISEMDFLESGEVSDVENAADIDIVSPENCESSPKSTSVTLGSQESEVCADTTEKAQNGNEEPKTVDESLKVRNDDHEKFALVVGGKYKSEINRDKLDLLIKFLKKEGGPVEDQTDSTEKNCPPSVINPTREDSWKQNRRKLSKTCVVKNKNTEREMVSLVSYKTPKCSSKASSAKNSLSEIVEIRDSDPTEGSDHSENDTKGVSEDKKPEENSEDHSECKVQSKNTQAAVKPLKETSENCSSNGKGVTTEERNIINIMRAFQNLKNHFCASCDFTSPVESIWINVVSGELRCLNCFKKMMLKAEENPSNLRKSNDDGVNASETEDVHKDEAGDGRGNKMEKSFEKKSKGEGQTKSASKPEDLNSHVKKEVDEWCESPSRNLKKESTLSKSSGKEQQDCVKRHVPVEQEEPELKNKGGKPARTNSAEEEHVSETHKKKETKQTIDSPERCRKRSNSAEEFVPQKVQILEEAAKEAKQKAPPVEKSVPKEFGGHQKNKSLEEAMKKSKKEDAKRQHSREGCTEPKTHKTEQPKLREEKREHEMKKKEDNVSEKYKRKRTSSVEDVDPKKIRMVEECTKGESKALSAERSKIRRDSKEDGHKNKTREKGKEEEMKARKHSESKEELHSQKGNGEPLNVTTKLFDLFDKLKKKSPPSETKQLKVEAADPICVSPRAKSPNEDCKMRKRTEGFEPSRNPQSPKNHRKEAKDEKDGQKKLIEKHYRKSKQYLISRLFKGKQNTKVNPKLPKLIGKEAPKVREHQKHHRKEEERKSEKMTQERTSHGHTHHKSLNKKVEASLDKRKVSGGNPTDSKRHTKELPAEESWTIKGRKDKAVGCSFREIMKDVGGGTKSKTMEKEITYSTALLARLMKKTKKLSLSLLGEA